MEQTAPIGTLDISRQANGTFQTISEPIFGGYANGRGDIALFGESSVYRVNFKNKTVQPRAPLNADAQARYDIVQAGETFTYCSVTFRRLSAEKIVEICSSGSFRITLRLI